ncbi:DUF6916 family protein [Roseateles koreensis]|uniref:DUF6916 family protein n=1 Tax=Roseateles koreensis TaxID=2987526 RepID=UPI0039648BB7
MLSLTHFSPFVGEHFGFSTAAEGPAQAHATLIEAALLTSPAFGARQPFHLIFEGPVESLLDQRTYQVRHAAFSGLELFIVPVGQSRSGIRYEAVFN